MKTYEIIRLSHDELRKIIAQEVSAEIRLRHERLNWLTQEAFEARDCLRVILGDALKKSAVIKDGDISQVPIFELSLSTRSRRALERNGMAVVGDVCSKSERELSTMRGIGGFTLAEIRRFIEARGLKLKEDQP